MTPPLRVLVVDDEPPIRRFLRASLHAQGYLVLEAEEGATALDLIRYNPPDVVVLDLGLPDIDGIEVIRRLRKEGSMVPVIVLSSRADEPGKVEALDLGADDYVTANFGVSGRRFRFKPAGDFGRNRQAVSVQSGTPFRRRFGAGFSEPPLQG
ncbi:MAG TPA: response regulator [Xanthobacteraceae bacterium]